MESPKQGKTEVYFSAKAGKFKVTVFKNERTGKSGTFDAYNTQLQKSWLKQDGDPKNKDDWQNQNISLFNAAEIEQAIIVLEEAKKKLLLSD